MQIDPPRCPVCSQPPRSITESVLVALELLVDPGVDSSQADYGLCSIAWETCEPHPAADGSVEITCEQGHTYRAVLAADDEPVPSRLELAIAHAAAQLRSVAGVLREHVPTVPELPRTLERDALRLERIRSRDHGLPETGSTSTAALLALLGLPFLLFPTATALARRALQTHGDAHPAPPRHHASTENNQP